MWTTSLRLAKYCIVGVINTLVCFGVMFPLAFVGTHYVIYSSVGYLCAFISSYTLNGIFTFQADTLNLKGFATFFAVNCSLLIVVNALQVSLIDGLGVMEYLGVGMGAVFYTLVGYVLNRNITYRHSLAS